MISVFIDSQGRRWRARRPDGWPIDQKAPDGFTVNGYRRVRKDGTFRMVGVNWVSPFTPGDIVYTWIDDCWATAVSAVRIDVARWNPETLNDDWRGFVHHAHGQDDHNRIVKISTERK